MSKKKGYANNRGLGSGGLNPPTRTIRDIGFRAPQPFSIIQYSTPDSEKQYREEKQDREAQLQLSGDQLQTAQRLNRITAIGAGISIFSLLGLIYSIVLSSQATNAAVVSANATKTSAEAQEAQFQIDNRAWIKVQLLHKSDKAPYMDIPEVGQPFNIPYYLYDIGKTPARNVIVEGAVELIPADLPVPVEQLVPDKPTLEETNRHGGIFPNDTAAAQGSLTRAKNGQKIPITREEIEAYNNGDLYVAVYGMAIYEDVFGRTHWTKFCNWMPSPNSSRQYRAQSCTDINGVDDPFVKSYILKAGDKR